MANGRPGLRGLRRGRRRRRRRSLRGRAPQAGVHDPSDHADSEDSPVDRRRPERLESERGVERVRTETGQRQRGRARRVEQRHLHAVRLGEDVRPVDADRGHDHHRDHQRRPDRPEQPEPHEHAAHDFRSRGGCGEEPAGPEAQTLEESCRAGQSISAKPSEEFLRSVRRHERTNHEPSQHQACIHVVTPCHRGSRGPPRPLPLT